MRVTLLAVHRQVEMVLDPCETQAAKKSQYLLIHHDLPSYRIGFFQTRPTVSTDS